MKNGKVAWIRKTIQQAQWKEWLVSLALTSGAAWLFYRSFWGLISGIVIVPFSLYLMMDYRKEKEENELLIQFQHMLQAAGGALQAGYSIEKAWMEGYAEDVHLYGKNAVCVQGFLRINQQVRMNIPIEDAIREFAESTQIEELLSFSEIFRYGKKNGGSMTGIINDTLRHLIEKQEMKEEIKTAVSAQQFEQRILMLMVPGILLFVTISSPEYVSALYENLLGVFIMTGGLIGYMSSCLWGKKIVEII